MAWAYCTAKLAAREIPGAGKDLCRFVMVHLHKGQSRGVHDGQRGIRQWFERRHNGSFTVGPQMRGGAYYIKDSAAEGENDSRAKQGGGGTAAGAPMKGARKQQAYSDRDQETIAVEERGML